VGVNPPNLPDKSNADVPVGLHVLVLYKLTYTNLRILCACFIPRDAMPARYMPLSVSLSCDVKSRYILKTAIMQITPHQGTLVLRGPSESADMRVLINIISRYKIPVLA